MQDILKAFHWSEKYNFQFKKLDSAERLIHCKPKEFWIFFKPSKDKNANKIDYIYMSNSQCLHLYIKLSMSTFIYQTLNVYLYISNSQCLHLYIKLSMSTFIYQTLNVYLYISNSRCLHLYIKLSMSTFIYQTLNVYIYISNSQ